MADVVALASFVLISVGIIALAFGGLPPLRIASRRGAGAVFGVGVLLLLGATLLVPTRTTAPPPAATRAAVASRRQPLVPVAAAARLPGATLGGPERAFVAALGPPGGDAGEGAVAPFARCPSGADRYLISFVGGRATTILRRYCGGVPSASERLTEARTYFPPDAPAHRAAYVDEDGNQARSYVSATLAALFPASAFQVCRDDTPAGTFELALTGSGWVLGIGECP